MSPSTDSQQNQGQGYGQVVVFLGLAYAILIALVVFASYRFTRWGGTDDIKNFASLVTVGITAVSAVLGAIIGFITLSRNQKAAVQLAEMNSRLQKDVQQEKAVFDYRIDRAKAKAEAVSGAYLELLQSISSAYELISRLESGTWKDGNSIGVDTAFAKGANRLFNIENQEHVRLWQEVRQRANFIVESAATLTGDDQSALWTKEAPDFNGKITAFKNVALPQVYPKIPTKEDFETVKPVQ